MRWMHARSSLISGCCLFMGVMVLLGARYAPSDAIANATASQNAGLAIEATMKEAAAMRDCHAWCSFAFCDDHSEHYADYSGGDDDEEGPHGTHSRCLTGTCAWSGGPEYMHPACYASQNLAKSGDYDRLKVAIRSADASSVHRLLRQYPKALTVNVRRQSIQVLGCDSAPLANLPLEASLYARLAHEQ